MHTQVIMSLYDFVSKLLNPIITYGLMMVNHYHCPPRLYLLEGSVLNLSCPCFFSCGGCVQYIHMEVSWNRGTPSYHPFEIGIFHYKPSILGYPIYGNPLYVYIYAQYIYIYAQYIYIYTMIYPSMEVASSRGKFLVGCDGGHSKVRCFAGLTSQPMGSILQ